MSAIDITTTIEEMAVVRSRPSAQDSASRMERISSRSASVGLATRASSTAAIAADISELS